MLFKAALASVNVCLSKWHRFGTNENKAEGETREKGSERSNAALGLRDDFAAKLFLPLWLDSACTATTVIFHMQSSVLLPVATERRERSVRCTNQGAARL